MPFGIDPRKIIEEDNQEEDNKVKEAIKKVVSGINLTTDESEKVMTEIMEGNALPTQIAALITAMRIKGETVNEIAGFARVMRKKATKIKTKHKLLVDTCGTGGDGVHGRHTFNISTVSAIVACGAGAVIAGFDEGVIGMKKGEKKTINIPADKAYGQYDEKKMGEYPKANVPKEMELKVGAKMFLQSPEGGVALATIKEIKDDVVILDLNHPLAGKDLTFEVEIVEVN